MIITRLELDNIKSYRRSTVDFAPGVNAICGLNGSGKTTVLEAIGFALFDYLPYSQQAFIREGEKNGTVRVRLLADDGREYEVVRKIGSGGAYYVADVESGMRLAERGPNVLDWMRVNALGIDGEADLEALFKNAVGVPQGLMTADFQVSGTTRKSIFDPLLRVEEYRDAFENLRETVSYLRNLSSTVSVEIGRLEQETDKIPQLRDDVAELQNQLNASEGRIESIGSELGQIQARQAVFDELESQLRELSGRQHAGENDVQRHSDMLAVHKSSLQAAIEARAAVRESEPGYRIVVQAQQQLATLEVLRKERDGLERDKGKVTAGIHGIYGKIEQLDEQHREAIAAADEAAGLSEAVARQQELEGQLQEAQLRVHEGVELDKRMGQLRDEIRDLERSRGARETTLEQARAAQGRIGRTQDVEGALQVTSARLAEMKPLKEQLHRLELEGKRWRQRLDTLREDGRRQQELRVLIEAKRADAESLDDLFVRVQEVRDERARALAAIDYQAVAREDLQRHHCPLLEVQCPVVTSDAGTLVRFDGRVDTLNERLQSLDAEFSALETRVKRARSAATELQSLEVQIARLERTEADLAEVETQVEGFRREYGELAKTLAEEEALRRSFANLTAELRSLQSDERWAARLPDLEVQQEDEGRRLEDSRRELANAESRRSDLHAVEATVQDLTAELAALDDPRAKQQGRLAVAGRRAALEDQIELEQERLTRESDRLKALVARLQEFEHLDQEMEEHRRLESEHRPAHEKYVANEAGAKQVEEFQQAVEATSKDLQAADAAVEEIRHAIAETDTQYDPEQHEILRARNTELGEEKVREREKKEHIAARLREQEEQLAYLQRLADKLLERRAEQDDLEHAGHAVAFIRDTIKTAGPAITETLLASISQIANDIYCEIMDDHAVELRWDRDYEVLVQRGSETRSFSQLSGGEQMSAALSVRLALLKEMSEVDVAFFDEPTQNMDGERRENLADQIRQVRGFDQLIVISHDDTFEHHTDNLIRLQKIEDETHLEVG